MIKLQEITEWGDSTPNHTYIVTKDKTRMLGYIKQGETEVIMFNRPLKFDKSRRKFKTLN